MQHKKLLVAGAATTAATAIVGATLVSSADAISGPVTLTLIAPDTQSKLVDVAPKGASLGDRFIFSGPLENAKGKERGRIDGECVTTGTVGDDPEEVRRQCVVSSTIGTESGEQEIQAQGVGRLLADDVLLSVTGGTLHYQNVRGEALFDYTQSGRVVITFRLIP